MVFYIPKTCPPINSRPKGQVSLSYIQAVKFKVLYHLLLTNVLFIIPFFQFISICLVIPPLAEVFRTLHDVQNGFTTSHIEYMTAIFRIIAMVSWFVCSHTRIRERSSPADPKHSVFWFCIRLVNTSSRSRYYCLILK